MQNAQTMCMAILLLIVGFAGAENLLFSDCGVRSSRRQTRAHPNRVPASVNPNQSNDSSTIKRIPKIMHGIPAVEGQYPWQVSLELLHPSYGFIGHWCGGVLIDQDWVLSAAHCIHNDLFNLPLPALWTVVLGEYDRQSESGFEQRIPVDKIILHEKYHNFKHDLVLLKMAKPANTSPNSRVRKICLPFADFKVNSMTIDSRPDQQLKPKPNSKPSYFFDQIMEEPMADQSTMVQSQMNDHLSQAVNDFPESVSFRDENFLRNFKKLFEQVSSGSNPSRSRNARYMVNQLMIENINSLHSNRTQLKTSSIHTKPNESIRDSRVQQNYNLQSSTRLFSTGIFGPSKAHLREDDNRKRFSVYQPFAERIVSTKSFHSRHQHHRVNLNSKFGNPRRRNDKFSHAPVYYRKEPNYRTEDGNDHIPLDDNPSSEYTEPEVGLNTLPSTAAMPDTSQYVDCSATGWGKSTIDEELTDVLLQTRAPIQNSKKCEEAYGDFIKLHRGHLCAGNLDGTGGTCVGDSGGPLQCRLNKHGPWILVGITSFGSGCAFKNYPDVYTKISFYRSWIVDTIQNN